MIDIGNVPLGWFLEKVEAEFDTSDEANESLQRIKEIIKIIGTVKENRKDWPTTEEWKNILPSWLLKAFRPEYTKAEIEKLLKDKQPRAGWSLEDWEFYIKDKVWEWWDGKAKDNKLIIEILVDGHPFSIYELKCLLELIGAKSVKLVD